MGNNHVAPTKNLNPANVDMLKHAAELANVSVTVTVMEMEVSFHGPRFQDLGHALLIHDSETPTVGMSLSKSELVYVGRETVDGNNHYVFHNRRGGMKVSFWR